MIKYLWLIMLIIIYVIWLIHAIIDIKDTFEFFRFRYALGALDFSTYFFIIGHLFLLFLYSVILYFE